MTATFDEIRRKRLLYQAQHRGFKEADLVIGGFAAENLIRMSGAELDAFEALLAYPDHDLYAWIKGETLPPPEVRGGVFDALRSFNVARLFSS
ncbi:MAG: succinate dehydrogenase assembly factor 2 [Parvularculaceae bacterium]